MTPVTPQELHSERARLLVMGEGQCEYIPLPASKGPDGLVMTEWQPSAEDLAVLNAGGRVRLWCWTFNEPLQPLDVQAVPFTGNRLLT